MLIDKCRAEWPELEWKDVDDEDRVGRWIVGHCNCGALVSVNPDRVSISWPGGLSFHNSIVAAREVYRTHAREVMKSAGYEMNEVDTVIDATDGRR